VVSRLPLGGDGGWDYLTADAANHLLYLSRADHVAVIDTASGKAVGEIGDTPGVHGIALAPELGRGFISAGKANQVKVFDLNSRKVLASIDVGSKPDAILYEPLSQRVFSFNGHSSDASVIDAKTNTVIATIALGGAPEFARTDGQGRIYVNLEDKNQLVSLDAKNAKLLSRWPLPSCDGPTGLALDAEHRRSFSVCANAVMTILDVDSGKLVTSLPIGKGVDGADFDAKSQMVFSANGEGTLTIVHETDPDHFQTVQTLTTQAGARTVVIDSASHRIYLPTASFGPVQPSLLDAHPKAPILPGTFVVLAVAPQS
jgi:YVTN family beta-propeller protein